jgi:hypothetical protein
MISRSTTSLIDRQQQMVNRKAARKATLKARRQKAAVLRARVRRTSKAVQKADEVLEQAQLQIATLQQQVEQQAQVIIERDSNDYAIEQF